MYISGKQAQLILNITTRQGLHKIVKEHNIEFKGQGAGKPNIYLESDVISVAEKTSKQRKKHNPHLEKKVAVKKKQIVNKVKTQNTQKSKADKKLQDIKDQEEIEIKKADEEYKKELQEIRDKQKEDIDVSGRNPLNEIGQSEFLRVEQILIENGTYQPLDRAVLLAYCISYQKYIDAVVRSEESDNVTMDDVGTLRIHPHFQVADKSLTQMIKLSNMLGISIRGRQGIPIKEKKKASVFDMLNPKEEF